MITINFSDTHTDIINEINRELYTKGTGLQFILYEVKNSDSSKYFSLLKTELRPIY